MESEELSMNQIEYNCAMGIVLDLMRKGMITPDEYDTIELKLKQKYGIDTGCAD